jgi:hypothetical protein
MRVGAAMLNYVSRGPKNQRQNFCKSLATSQNAGEFWNDRLLFLEADPAAEYWGKGEPNRQEMVKDEQRGSNDPMPAGSIHTAVVEEKSMTASSKKIICSESGLEGVQNDATDGASL